MSPGPLVAAPPVNQMEDIGQAGNVQACEEAELEHEECMETAAMELISSPELSVELQAHAEVAQEQESIDATPMDLASSQESGDVLHTCGDAGRQPMETSEAAALKLARLEDTGSQLQHLEAMIENEVRQESLQDGEVPAPLAGGSLDEEFRQSANHGAQTGRAQQDAQQRPQVAASVTMQNLTTQLSPERGQEIAAQSARRAHATIVSTRAELFSEACKDSLSDTSVARDQFLARVADKMPREGSVEGDQDEVQRSRSRRNRAKPSQALRASGTRMATLFYDGGRRRSPRLRDADRCSKPSLPRCQTSDSVAAHRQYPAAQVSGADAVLCRPHVAARGCPNCGLLPHTPSDAFCTACGHHLPMVDLEAWPEATA